MQPHPQAYTSTPPAPIPVVVPVLGLSTISTPGIEKTEKTTESQDVPVIPKGCHLTLTLVTYFASSLPSTSSSLSSLPSKSASYPVIVIPELAIPVGTDPECVNQPGGKDYLCHVCTFWHSDLDCILTHVSKHLNITISCPGCGKRVQMQHHGTNMGRRHT